MTIGNSTERGGSAGRDTDALQRRANELGPWRYDHSHAGVEIKGDPIAAPVDGALGRGRDTVRHIVRGLLSGRDPKAWRALDLGCLEGHYTDVLCEAGFGEVVAVELSLEHLARAKFLLENLRRHDNLRLIHGNVEDSALMRSLGTFNVVLFHGLLYHLKNPLQIFDSLATLIAPTEEHFLLLSTQFKFSFGEIVSPSPIANVKIRNTELRSDGTCRSEDNQSVYAPLALRLNPAAVFRILQRYGYRGLTGYDTPLGCRYGFHLHVIASKHDHGTLRTKLNRGHDIQGLRFYPWDGSILDSCNLAEDPRMKWARRILRIATALAERLGRSYARQAARADIPGSGDHR